MGDFSLDYFVLRLEGCFKWESIRGEFIHLSVKKDHLNTVLLVPVEID